MRAYTLARPEIVTEQVSVDGTRKWLLRLPRRGREALPPEIETVYIPEIDRGTLCISSQVGCTLNCSFCHTGTQRLVRNLEAQEIVGQIMLARDRIGDWPGAEPPGDGRLLPDTERKITNIVLMGMGEPLYNFENVKAAMEIASDGEGLSISKRRITLSTSRRGAGDPPLGRRERHDARHLPARHPRRAARQAGADQPQVPDCRADGGLPGLSGPLQRQPHHLRVRDAEGRQRQPRRRQGAGEAAAAASRPRST